MSLIKRILRIKDNTENSPRLRFSGKAEDAYHKHLLNYTEANQFIKSAVLEKKACMITRIGASELKAVNNYLVKGLSNYGNIDIDVIEELYTHSGVFPATEIDAAIFCNEYINAIKGADLIGVWDNVGEALLIKLLAYETALCKLSSLEPFFVEDPWSQYLSGKKVLIVHPFEKTILSQYKKRESLFNNKSLLPDFELKTIKAVQSLSGADKRFDNWMVALDYIKTEIDKIDFDIAIIGAGSYGLPLASFIKALGKTAIHLGGSSQLLFGIKGKRWAERKDFARLFNENWIYPLEEEKPEHGGKADNTGPYWA